MNNSRKLTIALDVMGGDKAPHSVLEGAELALSECHNLHFILYGESNAITANLDKLPKLKNASTVVHTESVISADDKPSVALRKGKESSMWLAINAAKEKLADAVVSAGNTGALMAIAKLLLRTLPDIDRPAIAGLMPSKSGKFVMLDLGANAECDSNNLLQFAIMGDAFAKAVLNVELPRIGLLNIGSEDVKGNDTVKNTATLLKEVDHLNFIGYVEGTDIVNEVADVIVADGFTGNIALKTAEGTADLCRAFMSNAFKSSWLSKLGYLMARSALKNTFKRLDHRFYNGAMFVGLGGIVVKSHGSSDPIGSANAIKVAYQLAFSGVNQRIIDELENTRLIKDHS